MRDKQNSSLDEDESLPARDEERPPEPSEMPRSYYYDDATGYEIYHEQENGEMGEEDNSEDE